MGTKKKNIPGKSTKNPIIVIFGYDDNDEGEWELETKLLSKEWNILEEYALPDPDIVHNSKSISGDQQHIWNIEYDEPPRIHIKIPINQGWMIERTPEELINIFLDEQKYIAKGFRFEQRHITLEFTLQCKKVLYSAEYRAIIAEIGFGDAP